MTCQRHEKVPAVNHPALAIEVTGIHDRISVDLILGLPLTDEGYLGIITICESLSKRVEAYPIKSKAMGEISQHVWSYICRYGPPKECLSDQGNEWCNSMFKNMLSSLGVEHKVTSAYFARTNGQVERNNRTLMQSLRKHTEEHPTQWNKWLDFVVMAYNSRVHSSTNFTPHELCFGRKMNGFESWDTKPATDDVAALNQRALQIKNLVENQHELAKLNIKKSQEIQKRNQDSNSRVEAEFLTPGTSVFVKTEGILSKLTPRYRGPFTVVEVTSKGNYILENALEERLDMSVPRSKLKVVDSEYDENNYENAEIEKILDFKKDGNQFIYLVKWKNSEDQDWLSVDRFNTLEIINEFHAKLEEKNNKLLEKPSEQKRLLRKKKEERIQPNRLVKKRKVDEAKITNGNVEKRGRGRPKKSNLVNFSLKNVLTFIFVVFHLFVGNGLMFMIEGDFKYCDVSGLARVDVEASCELKSSNNRFFNKTENGTYQTFYILDKTSHMVHGLAKECSKTVTVVKTYTDFFGRRSRNQQDFEAAVSESECHEMSKHNVCEGTLMNCEEGHCESANKALETYSWWHEETSEATNCRWRNISISADSIDSFVFNEQCKAKDLTCRLLHGRIVWDTSVIQACAFQFVSELKMQIKESDILIATELNLALEVTNSYVDPFCGKSTIYETTEGLFVSKEVESKSFPEVERSQKLIDKFVLSEEDMLRYTSYQVYRHFVYQACLNQKMILRSFKTKQDEFLKIEDFDGSKLMVYSKNGAIWVPKCTNVSNVNVYLGLNGHNNCIKGVAVNFTIGKKVFKGYLTDDFVIRSETVEDICGDKEFLLGDILIKKDNNSVRAVKTSAAHVVKLNPHNFNEKISLIHSKVVIDGYEALAEFPSLQPLAVKAEVELNGKAIKTSSNFIMRNLILNLILTVYNIRWFIVAIVAVIIILLLTYVCKAVTVVGWTIKSICSSCIKFCNQKILTRGALVFKRKRKESTNGKSSELTFKKLKAKDENERESLSTTKQVKGRQAPVIVDDSE